MPACPSEAGCHEMTKHTMKNEHVHCDVEELLRIIGGRWKVLLIRELENGPRRHGELLRSMGGITQKMLTQRLRELEADGIASRQYLMEGRVKVAEYSLTEWGTRVMGIVMEIHHWAVRHHEQLGRPEAGAVGQSSEEALIRSRLPELAGR